jgi:hypothetical protein
VSGFQPSLRDWIIFSKLTQDFILGYSQPSLRDFLRVFRQAVQSCSKGLTSKGWKSKSGKSKGWKNGGLERPAALSWPGKPGSFNR